MLNHLKIWKIWNFDCDPKRFEFVNKIRVRNFELSFEKTVREKMMMLSIFLNVESFAVESTLNFKIVKKPS